MQDKPSYYKAFLQLDLSLISLADTAHADHTCAIWCRKIIIIIMEFN